MLAKETITIDLKAICAELNELTEAFCNEIACGYDDSYRYLRSVKARQFKLMSALTTLAHFIKR